MNPTTVKIAEFIRELDELRIKYDIPAITGVVLKDNYMIPFGTKAKILTARDVTTLGIFDHAIVSTAEQITGKKGDFYKL